MFVVMENGFQCTTNKISQSELQLEYYAVTSGGSSILIIRSVKAVHQLAYCFSNEHTDTPNPVFRNSFDSFNLFLEFNRIILW